MWWSSGNWLPVIVTLSLAGCSQRMDRQPRYEPLEASDFFSNGMASRPRVAGAVSRERLELDPHFVAGKIDGKPVDSFPTRLLQEKSPADILARGRERFDIYCAVCHDRVGTGEGMVVQRGFPNPPTFHSERLRAAPVGHLFDVATNGFGRMPSYASQISTEDRWAIVAYVRTLQFSQNVVLAEIPAELRTEIEMKLSARESP